MASHADRPSAPADSSPAPTAPSEPAATSPAFSGPFRGFASDNHAGVHPEVLAALAAANEGHQPAYGDDTYTARLREVMRRHFGEQAETYPVFNGTGANVVGLQAMADPWSSVLCTETSHIHVDECGAAERVAGLKLIPIPTPDGKLTPELVDRYAWGWGDPHHAQPKIVSITQSTEMGTLYTAAEVTALASCAHERGMLLHMDGARLSNAASALDQPPRAFTTDAGVDVLSYGGTKNGLMIGEAIVVLAPSAVRGMEFLRKMGMQLASKMRFVSAQLIALLEGDLWLRNAAHANAMAQHLASAVRAVPGVRITQPVQANAVFAVIPADVADRLRKRYAFSTWNEQTGEVRWMCAFDTTEDDIAAFARALAEEMTA
ncbi:threonine aldolase family protein [Spirillospora sp. CA-255316]